MCRMLKWLCRNIREFIRVFNISQYYENDISVYYFNACLRFTYKHIIRYSICYAYLSTITLNYCLIFTRYIIY